MATFFGIPVLLAVIGASTGLRLDLRVATIITGAALVLLALAGFLSGTLVAVLVIFYLFAAVLLNAPRLRQGLLSRPLLMLFRSLLPSMSNTEREALEAGTIWWDAELFSGQPD